MNGFLRRKQPPKCVPVVIPPIGTAPGRDLSNQNYKHGYVELLHAVEVHGDRHMHFSITLYEQGLYKVPEQLSEDIAKYLLLRRLALPFVPSPWCEPQ